MNEHSSQGQDREGRHRKKRDRKREKKREKKKQEVEDSHAKRRRKKMMLVRGKGYLENAFRKTDCVLLKNRRVIGLLFEFGWQVIDVFDPDHNSRTSFVQRVRCSQLEHILNKEKNRKQRKENVTV